jgi:hypothetical protein
MIDSVQISCWQTYHQAEYDKYDTFLSQIDQEQGPWERYRCIWVIFRLSSEHIITDVMWFNGSTLDCHAVGRDSNSAITHDTNVAMKYLYSKKCSEPRPT